MIRAAVIISTILFVSAGPHLPAGADDAALLSLQATFRVTDGSSSGTCFIVDVSKEGVTDSALMIVTAEHVFRQMNGTSCKVILRKANESGLFDRHEIEIAIREGQEPLWTKHPSMDVAALPVTLPHDVDLVPFPYDHIADASHMESGKISVGQQCLIPCFPSQLESNSAGWPVLRRAGVASHPLHPVAEVRTFLADYASFGGDSGAPVVQPMPVHSGDGDETETPIVVGIVIGHHRQTVRTVTPIEERTVHSPLGIAICIQSEFIRETIELARVEHDE